MDQKKTAPFRTQHDKLLKIAGEISSFLTSRVELVGNSSNVNKLLTKLSRELRVHLTLEDTSLYPILINSINEELRDTTKEYMNEMGNIKEQYAEYSARWFSAYSIKESPDNFIKETTELFSILSSRIERENTQLYKMIDEIFQ